MLELMSYGLTGLAAAVVVAPCFAYSGGFSTTQEKRLTVYGNEACWPISRQIGERGAGTIDNGAIDNNVLTGHGTKEAKHA